MPDLFDAQPDAEAAELLAAGWKPSSYGGAPAWKHPNGRDLYQRAADARAERGKSGLIVCVDFDGTLVDHRFPDIGEPVPGAFDWLRRWQAAGARLILWTMRSDGRAGEGKENGPVLSEAVEFCRAAGVEFWGVNTNPQQASWTGSPKAYAHLYVDDAGCLCPLLDNPRAGGRPYVDWDVVGPAVMAQIEEHNRRKAT